jgi:hypothetical protein
MYALLNKYVIMYINLNYILFDMPYTINLALRVNKMIN